MSFGEVFGKSWKEYRDNFKAIFVLFAVFLLIPSLIVLVIDFIFLSSSNSFAGMFFEFGKSVSSLSFGKLEFYYMFKMLLLGLAVFFLSLFAQASLFGASVKDGKYAFKNLLDLGSKNYGRFLIFMVVSSTLLFLLFLLFIIPGIIFLVYWIFGVYIFLEGKGNVWDSLRKSREIVRGRWWRVFGYGLLFILICFGISIAVSLITLPTGLFYVMSILKGNGVSVGLFIANAIINSIANFLTSLLTVPLAVLFFKNLYLELKRGKK